MRRMLVACLVVVAVACGAVRVYDKSKDSPPVIKEQLDRDQFVRVSRTNLCSSIRLRGRAIPSSSTKLKVPSLQALRSNYGLTSYIRSKGAVVPYNFRSTFMVKNGKYVEKGETVAVFDPREYNTVLELWQDYIAEKELAYDTLLATNREIRDTYRSQLEDELETVNEKKMELADYKSQGAHEERVAIQSRQQKARIAYGAAKERVSGIRRLLSEAGTDDSALRTSLEKQLAEAEKTETKQLDALRKAIAEGSQFQTKLYYQNIEDYETIIHFAKLNYSKKVEEIQKRLEQMTVNETKRFNDLERQKKYLKDARKEAEKLTMKAPKDGVVIISDSVYWRHGRINMGQQFGQIPNDYDWRVGASFPQVLLPQIRPGMPVTVRFLTPSVSVQGQIQKITGANSTTIKVEGEVKGLSIGALALIEIPTAKRDEVLCAPIESVVTENGQSYCMVGDGYACHRREVKCGVRNNRFVEIISGVEENDLVLRNPRQLRKDQFKRTTK